VSARWRSSQAEMRPLRAVAGVASCAESDESSQNVCACHAGSALRGRHPASVASAPRCACERTQHRPARAQILLRLPRRRAIVLPLRSHQDVNVPGAI
jgi:hypothetical protein